MIKQIHSKKIALTILITLGLLMTSLVPIGLTAHSNTVTSFSSVASSRRSEDTHVENTKTISQSIELVYYFDRPTLETQNGRDLITIGNLDQYDLPGKPLVPFQTVNVLLPSQTTVDSIDVSGEGKISLPGSHFLANGQEPVPLSYTGSVEVTPPDPEIYQSKEQYPGILYEQVSIQSFRGFPILVLNLFPMQYSPATGEISYYTQMRITVHTCPNNAAIHQFYRGNFEDEKIAAQKVENPDAIDSYPRDMQCSDQEDTYDLLIVTTNELRQGFEPLAMAHNEQGIRTIIKLLGTDIPVSNDVNETCENIRNYIRYMYTTCGIDYVLLGGDIELIPSAYLYYGDVYEFGQNFVVCGPSDLYYACLDGPFNFDGDARWGEPTDGEGGTHDVDLMAEVYVGRACVATPTEVGYFVSKTLAYENQELDESYLRNVSLVGQLLDETFPTWGGTYMDQLIDGCSADGYTTVGISSDNYQIGTLYDRDWQEYGWEQPHVSNRGGWPKELLINLINNGTHFINNLGHASSLGNMKLKLRFGNDLRFLTNDKYCFIYSQGCHAGAYDWDYIYPPEEIYDCIAEHFTIKSEHGAFAGIWNSRHGWYQPGSTNGPSQRYHRQFWDAVFGENISIISQANQDSKEDNLGRINSARMRFCYYELNLFGDPTLAFRIPIALQVDAHGLYKGAINVPIPFIGSATGGSPPYVSWLWDFGDGSTSEEQNPTKTYYALGNYSVSLTVTDSCGNTSMNITMVTIKPFLADAHGPYKGYVNQSVQFNGSLIGDGGTPAFTWLWDFGDGSPSEEQNPSYQYHHTGVYLVMLTVTDNQNYNDTTFTSALIAEELIADAHGSYEWAIDLPLQFTGSALGGFAPYTYHWDFGDGNISEEQNPTNIYHAVGNYSVSLTVTDSCGNISTNITGVTVKPFLVDTHGPYIGYVNRSVQFTGSLIGDGGTPGYTWLWDFGDGSTSEAQNPLKNYTQVGYYIVNLTIIDSQLNIATDTTTATIYSVVYVDNDFNENTPGWGIDHFNTIRNGIDAASPGSAIYVSRGTYNETINVSKSLSLIGEDIVHTVIDGKSQGNVVVITADEVTITGFTIKGSSIESSGIYSCSNYTSIFGNYIRYNGCGIQLTALENTITDNTIRSNMLVGVFTTDTSRNNRIFHNNFISNNFNALDSGSNNLWDNGYPSGGNYWDDHPTFVDDYSGPDQTLPGSDGIIDTSYVFEDAEDLYPFMEPDGWDSVCPVLSSVLLSPGGLVTCPAGDGPAYQNISVIVNDFDGEPIPGVPAEEFLILVNTTNTTQWYGTFGCTFAPIDSETNANGMIRFEVKGETSIIGNIVIQATVMGYPLQDTDVLSCKSMDYDVNGQVGLGDFVLFGQDYGGTNWRSDFTWDGMVSLGDFVVFAQHYGHHG